MNKRGRMALALAPQREPTLAMLPLRADAPIYLARVDGVRVIPVYNLTVKP